MGSLSIFAFDLLLLRPFCEDVFLLQLRILPKGGLPSQIDTLLRYLPFRLTQGAVRLGAQAVFLPAQYTANALLGKHFPLVGGLHSHILTLGFMNFSVELHDCRCFRHAARTGGEGRGLVFRLDFFLKTQVAADFSGFNIRLPLYGQAAFGRQILPRLFDFLFRSFLPAHSFLIFFLLAWRHTLSRWCRGSSRSRRRILKP